MYYLRLSLHTVLHLVDANHAYPVLQSHQMQDDKQKMLRPSEVEERYSIPMGTLAYWRYCGTGPNYVRFSSRCIRYEVEALERWIAQHKVTTSN